MSDEERRRSVADGLKRARAAAEAAWQWDMIIPWADVQIGDLALDGGSLILVDSVRVHPQSDEHPDFMVACVSGWHVLDDGTPATAAHLDPPAAALTAIRRSESGLPPLHAECGPCEGHGVVTAPDWLDHDARCKQARQEWEAANPGASWHSSPVGREWEDGYPDIPEIPCGECSGTGYQMTAAGREIMYFLRVHGKG